MDNSANLGPLTTQWTPPASCTVPILENACSATECTAYHGYMCLYITSSSTDVFASGSLSSSTVSVFRANSKMTVDTACFPPFTLDLSLSFESRLNGYGYYSPGLECPSGYTKSWLLAPDGKGQRDWAPRVATAPGETVAGCCPSGYTRIDAGDNSEINSCRSYLRSTTYQAVPCAKKSLSQQSTILQVPSSAQAKETMTTVTQHTLFARFIELRWQATDIPANGPSGLPPSSDPPSPGGLSAGAKAGIGIGAALGALLLLGGLVFLLRRYRRRRLQREPSSGNPRQEIDGVQKNELPANRAAEGHPPSEAGFQQGTPTYAPAPTTRDGSSPAYYHEMG